MLPLFVDMTGTRVAVFGAGPVGVRKANYFAREAEVAAIARSFADGLDRRVRTVRADIAAELRTWVGWADLVVAATDDRQLNDEVVREAERQGRPCNRADGTSSFFIPSIVEKDGYVVAVSTLGRSPGMSRFLRLWLDEALGPRFGLMVGLQEELREAAKEKISSPREREAFLWSILRDESVWKLLEERYEEARGSSLARLEGWHGPRP